MSTTPPRINEQGRANIFRALEAISRHRYSPQSINSKLSRARENLGKIGRKMDGSKQTLARRNAEPQDNWFLSRVTSLHARNFAYRSLSPAWGHGAKAWLVRFVPGKDRKEGKKKEEKRNGRTLNRVTREANKSSLTTSSTTWRMRRVRGIAGDNASGRSSTQIPKATNARTTVRPRIGNYPRNVHALLCE